MKSIFCILLVLFCFSDSIIAQCTILANATTDITLACVGSTANRSGVAYNPQFGIYYSCNAGNGSYPFESFDATGTPVANVTSGFDYRGLWWNPNVGTGRIEGNGFSTNGLHAQNFSGVNGYGQANGTVFLTAGQPNSQSCGDYDFDADEVIYYDGGSIYRYSHTTAALLGSYAITGLPVATGSINSYGVIYVGCSGQEIGVYDYVNRRLYFINKTTGAYSGTFSQLPLTAPNPGTFRMSYANNRFFVFDGTTKIWHSYVVITPGCAATTITPSVNICSGDSMFLAGNYQFSTGVYTDSLTDVGGCDSIVVTSLTVNSPISTTQNITLCAGQSLAVGASTYSTTGNYLDTVTASTGCDSMVATNLIVDAVIASTQSATLCAGESMTVGTSVYTTTGNYTDVLAAVNGCDSTVTTNLIVDAAIVTVQSMTLCAGQSMMVGTNTYSSTGNYIDVLTAADGCDSTVTTDLIVNAPIVTNQTAQVCAGQSITIGTSVYTTAGNYTDVLTASDGCDSTVNTSLTVNLAPVVAMAPIAPDTFCIGVGTIMFSGTLPIGGVYTGGGVNQNTFNPTLAGVGTHAIVYTVTDANGCVGADSVVVVVELCSGMEAIVDFTDIRLYPNPTSSIVYINLEGVEEAGELILSVYDVLGRMLERRLISETIEAIDLSREASGIYLIRVEGEGGQFLQRVIKE